MPRATVLPGHIDTGSFGVHLAISSERCEGLTSSTNSVFPAPSLLIPYTLSAYTNRKSRNLASKRTHQFNSASSESN